MPKLHIEAPNCIGQSYEIIPELRKKAPKKLHNVSAVSRKARKLYEKLLVLFNFLFSKCCLLSNFNIQWSIKNIHNCIINQYPLPARNVFSVAGFYLRVKNGVL